MAKKKDERIILEDIELKPQVLGYTYQKKNNIGRVIIIFIAFALVVYFIDDISLFFNDLLGRETASTIKENATINKDEEENITNNDSENKEEIEYYPYAEDLNIDFNNLSFDSFNINNNILTFDVNNLKTDSVDVSTKKLFLETYDANKNLIDRLKLDITSVVGNSKITLRLNIKDTFNYITIVEKNVEDYPAITFDNNGTGENTITCTKGIETITYTFSDASLIKINHKVVDSMSNADYNTNLNNYQSKVNNYKQIEGLEASLTTNQTGYTVDITLDLEKVDLSKINEKYYYAFREDAKVIKYEMPAYGFTCD